jgi:hypothetical protein
MLQIIWLAVVVFLVVAFWKIFVKAGQPGWACLVPFYNFYVMTLKIAGLPLMWFIFCFIPILNIVAMFKIYIELAKKFGKGVGFGVGLVFLSFIFAPILGFGDAKYLGEAPPAAPAQ